MGFKIIFKYKITLALWVTLSYFSPIHGKIPYIEPQLCSLSSNLHCQFANELELYKNLRPEGWIKLKLNTFISETDAFTLVAPLDVIKPQELQIKAKRNPFRDHLYKLELIEASHRTALMSDKLIMSKILEHYLGDEFGHYHLKSIGLKEFLSENKILDKDGYIIKTRLEIKNLLVDLFPNGFLLKPATGMSSAGENFIADMERVIDLIISQNGQIYSPKELSSPYKWSELPIITSGERFLLQEVIPEAASSIRKGVDPLFYQQDSEFRVHSFWDLVVPDATSKRWYTKENKLQNEQANAFTQSLLSNLPLQLTQFQAWSFDVFRQNDGTFKLIEINTNRGQKTNWSGFNRVPQNLGAYIRFFEDTYNWKFKGLNGLLLRNDLGNLKSHFAHEYLVYLEEYKQILKGKLNEVLIKKPQKRPDLLNNCLILMSHEY